VLLAEYCSAPPPNEIEPEEPSAFAEPTARCSYGDCRLDADCAARAGGQCRPFFNPCNRRLDGFHCTYAGSACRQDTDCSDTPFGYCAPGLGGMTSCQTFIPPP
jgi:hypothetical protein